MLALIGFASLYRSDYSKVNIYNLAEEYLGNLNEVLTSEYAYSYIFSIEMIENSIKIILRNEKLYGELPRITSCTNGQIVIPVYNGELPIIKYTVSGNSD